MTRMSNKIYNGCDFFPFTKKIYNALGNNIENYNVIFECYFEKGVTCSNVMTARKISKKLITSMLIYMLLLFVGF